MNCIRMVLILFFSVIAAQAKIEQTRDFAKHRKSQLKDLAYSLFFDLDAEKLTYGGRADISFELLDNSSPLFLDFSGASVEQITVAGKAVTFAFNGEDARIKITGLQTGLQTLTVSYTGKYSQTGVGLHRYVDPEDQRVYLYTDFEPQDAHKAFPCFDQPDLKATFQVEAAAPIDWTIITNTLQQATRLEGSKRVSSFKRSKKFSTYLFNLSAGPYASFHDGSFRYPLGLYARQSMAQYVDAEKLFETTRKGFGFFEDYFATPYPFEKYDQIFCPEFNSGAMENVAAVTWNEGALPKTPPTQDDLMQRDITLLHEMAHMWFGDLVTMIWWDDLWLNESFATYMSYLAATDIGWESAWDSSRRQRNGAIISDRKSTTHPILADVPDITTANSIFDSITYGKGFCALRQLDMYLGGSQFRDGLRIYFRKNAWGNTKLEDFTSALEEASGQDLDDWMESWLGTTGINTVKVAFSSQDGKISAANILQIGSDGNNLLRQHALNLGLFYEDDEGNVKLEKTTRIVISASKTDLPELIGMPAPAFILPNVDQKDYLLTSLDAHSQAWLKARISKLADPNTRLDVWEVLWRMVKDGQWDPQEFLELAAQELPHEENAPVVSRLASMAMTAIDDFTPKVKLRKEYASRYLDIARARLKQNPGSDEQQNWFSISTRLAYYGKNTAFLADLFTGKEVVEGMPMHPDHRWGLLAYLVKSGYPIREEQLAEMAASDPSGQGKWMMFFIEASWPNAATKKAAWHKILNGTEYSLKEIQAIGIGFYDNQNPELMRPYLQSYFQELPQLEESKGWNYVSGFARFLWPEYGNQETLKAAEQFLKNQSISLPLRTVIEGKVENLERDMKIRANWGRKAKSKPTA